MNCAKNYSFVSPLKKKDVQGKTSFQQYIISLLQITFYGKNVCVTVDGAAALTGRRKGFKAKVIEIAHHTKFVHCIIHRQVVAAKKLETEKKSYSAGCCQLR